MRDGKSAGSTTDRTDWSSAWQAVSRLAAARDSLRRMDPAPNPLPGVQLENAEQLQANSVMGAAEAAALDAEQLAGAIAEIEKASAVLRRSEPALELGFPGVSAHPETRTYWSLWILIGAVWISATLVVASATGAILYLLG
jgi:hypothetical protein